MAAHVLGHVGQVSEDELKMRAFRGDPGRAPWSARKGSSTTTTAICAANPGMQRVEVDSAGNPVPSNLLPTAPIAGHSLKVTLDLGLQRESEKALLQGIENARAGGKPAKAGAFVAMDPRTGQVLAMGSYPTFDPNRFAKPLTQREYDQLIGNGGSSGPLDNRAVNGAYPTGSTFKPITAMAALEAGILSPNEGLGAGQCIEVSTEKFCNAGLADFGAVGLVEALKVSSDTYFFEVGERANPHGAIIQAMAHKLGVGQPTGIDLPSELEGVVPDSKWRAKQNAAEEACRRRTHKASCGIVSETRPWSVGDNMHLAVGQGDLLTNPLQMAVAYSTMANAFTQRRRREGRHPAPRHGDRRKQRRPRAEPERAAQQAGAPELLRPQPRDGRHPRGRQPAGRHLRRRLVRLEPVALPRLREDGHGRTLRAGRPVLVHGLHRRPGPPDRDRGHRGTGRLRRRNGCPDHKADGVAVVSASR